jgi:DNA-binding HxlR family transcriptional regulator
MNIPSVRILIFIYDKGEVRYTDLTKKIESRGTLSKSMRDLIDEGLVDKKIVKGKPIKSFYTLTSNGKEIAKRMYDIDRYYS